MPNNWSKNEYSGYGSPISGLELNNNEQDNNSIHIDIAKFARGKNDIPGCDLEDYMYTDRISTETGLNCSAYYDVKNNSYSIYLRLYGTNLYDIGIYVDADNFTDKTKQVIFNVLNSIEITKLTTDIPLLTDYINKEVFSDDIVDNIDNFIPYEYGDEKCAISVKAPNDWYVTSHYPSVTHENPRLDYCGISVSFSQQGDIFIKRYLNDYLYEIDKTNYPRIEEFETNSNIKGKLYYYQEPNYVAMVIRFDNLPTYKIEAVINTDKYKEIKTDLYNFFKSVEIMKKTE